MKRVFDNKGYSLVELLVVVAIMAIGLTLFTISIATVYNNNVRSAASDIDAMIGKGVVNSNYRYPLVFIEIFRDTADNNNLKVRYYENSDTSVVVDEKTVGGSNIAVALNGFTAADLPLRLAFNRGTGEILEITDITSTPITTVRFSSGSSPAISLGNTGAGRYVITLTPNTGGHVVSKG